MNIHEQLEVEVKAHNELHANIQQGETQIEAMKAERERRLGRAQMLQELIQAETADVDAQPIHEDDPATPTFNKVTGEFSTEDDEA